MKASELIKKLEATIDVFGDLDVETYDFTFTRKPVEIPQIAYRKILTGRQSKACFWSSMENDAVRGDMVIRL